MTPQGTFREEAGDTPRDPLGPGLKERCIFHKEIWFLWSTSNLKQAGRAEG